MVDRNRFFAAPALALLLTLTALAVPEGVAAQGQGPVPLFLAIPETFPDVDGRAVLLRESGRDVVLLRDTDATPETLSVALQLLKQLEERSPRRQGQVSMVPITGYKLTTPVGADRYAELDAALAQLRERPVSRLGNLGFGRFMPFVNASR